MGFIDRGGPWVVGQVILFALILIAGWARWASFEPLSTAGTITFWVGIAIVILAFVSLGQNLTPYPEPLADAELIERGPYRLVRHPIYTGVILTFTGFSIRAGSWVALGADGIPHRILLAQDQSRRSGSPPQIPRLPRLLRDESVPA